jgi:hypothetical protein
VCMCDTVVLMAFRSSVSFVTEGRWGGGRDGGGLIELSRVLPPSHVVISGCPSESSSFLLI